MPHVCFANEIVNSLPDKKVDWWLSTYANFSIKSNTHIIRRGEKFLLKKHTKILKYIYLRVEWTTLIIFLTSFCKSLIQVELNFYVW